MKLEHLIQGYISNNITVKEINKIENAKSQVLEFSEDIYATCFNNGDVVTSIQIFANAVCKDKILNKQFEHTTYLLMVLSTTIDLLSNINSMERNLILKELGLFDGKFIEGKIIKHLDKTYSVKVNNGLVHFIINEI